MREPLEVDRAPTGADLEAAQVIRRRVFVQEQGIPAELDRDGQDREALQVLVRLEGVAAATGRVVVEDDGEAVLARIAVLPEFRGRGLGRRVVEELERLAAGAGARRLVLRPHDHLEDFYRRLGYVTVAGEERVAGHRLLTMVKELEARQR